MAESGNCKVCSAPCTSCMHFNRLVAGVKTEAFSDNITSQHSASKSAIFNPLKKHASDNLQYTDSATSSHEFLPEYNETVRALTLEEASPRKSEKDRNESSISNLVDSSFVFVGAKQELHGLDYAENDEGGPVVSSSDVLKKPEMKLELKTERDNNYSSEDSLDVVSAPKGSSDDPAELTDVTEPSSDSHSDDASDEVMEQDVNICDICGDVGREDLLATCSGCSDGAEHTYCMQEKMEKVPEGEWFCEECRIAEKNQKQRDIGDGTAKVQPLSRLRSLNKNLSLKLDSKESSVDGNSLEICAPGTQSRKRLLERVDSSAGFKRQATEITKDLSTASSPRCLSKDGSFIGDREKVNKLSKPNHGINDSYSRPQTHKGPLIKSNSFNAVSLKSKGKSIADVQHKKKTQCEFSDAQDGANRLMARSMSLRPVHLGRPNACEPKVIMLSPKSSNAPEMKGFRKLKEHPSYDRKKSTRDEQASSMSSSLPSISDKNRKNTSGKNRFFSTDHKNKDLTSSDSDEKVAPPSKSTAHESKLNKLHGKDESTSGTWTASKRISNVDAISHPDLLPPQDGSYQAVNRADNNLTGSQVGKSISGSNLCQRCNEPSSASHVCLTTSPRLSASEASAVKIPAVGIEKMNPVKAALHAAFLKKSIICKTRRAPDHVQFEEQPITPNLNGQNALHDVWSGSNYMKNTSSTEINHIQKLPLTKFRNGAGQESGIDPISHSSLLSKKMVLHADVGCDGKSMTEVFPGQSLPHVCTVPTSAIPLHEYIWQGDFVVNVNGDKVADMHPGFQAHLSTFASPKVVEVVHKLSPRLSLTAIPRLSTWPAQFQETGATEDNIALYFFAKDIESYERYYKTLLDSMMRNDLALKGVVNGVEILIFPSRQLPQKSQRWNMLFFMWGVFRAKKQNCESQMVDLSRNADAFSKSCIIRSDASPSVPMPPCTVPSVVSEKLDCVLNRDSISGSSSSCTQSLVKRNPPDSYEEERVVDMEYEVKPKATFNGGTAVTDRPAMLGNKCASVPKSSVIDVQGQELNFVGRVMLNNDEEKEVHVVTIEGKEEKDDSDVKPVSKKEPSMNDESLYLHSDNENLCNGEVSKISCIDSDTDISKTQLTSLCSKDVKIHCSTDAHETGPTVCSKKIIDLNLDAGDTMEESDKDEGFLSAVEFPQMVNFQGAKSSRWDLNSSANDIKADGDFQVRQDITSCADTESFPPKNGALPLFVGMGEHFEGGVGKKEETPAASLSLSLALPFMDEKLQPSSKQATSSAEQLHCASTQGKPPFLLFGRRADK